MPPLFCGLFDAVFFQHRGICYDVAPLDFPHSMDVQVKANAFINSIGAISPNRVGVLIFLKQAVRIRKVIRPLFFGIFLRERVLCEDYRPQGTPLVLVADAVNSPHHINHFAPSHHQRPPFFTYFEKSALFFGYGFFVSSLTDMIFLNASIRSCSFFNHCS